MEKVTFNNPYIESPVVKNYIGKRWFDIGGSLLFLMIFSPVLLIVGLLVLFFSGRPILYRQVRSGLNGRPFVIWKFRTMKNDFTHSQHFDHWKEGVPEDFVFKTAYDHKVTGIGKILRKYSIDELPQFFNVLEGSMSLIGPRPEIVEITNCYDSNQSQRLLVKPGITGYAQINGRSLINHGKKIELDRYYVQHCSFTLDIKILLLTVFLVLRGKGAF